jgi:hypothetical protein
LNVGIAPLVLRMKEYPLWCFECWNNLCGVLNIGIAPLVFFECWNSLCGVLNVGITYLMS